MIQLGDIEIHLIDGGVVWMDRGGPFGLVPRALWSRFLPPDEHDRIPMILTCLLVRSGGQNILVDTAYGDKLDEKARDIFNYQEPRGSLIDGLARLDLSFADVDIVINTHLHGDHCSGNTTVIDGEAVPAFPNAQYYVQRREYEDAMMPNERTRATYQPLNYQPLLAADQLTLLDGDPADMTGQEIAPGVHVVVTPGHTPGHQCVRFESGGQQALFVADLASYAVHFERLGWMTAYDVEPLITLETKRRWAQWAIENDALLLFQHDTQVPAGHLRESDDGRRKIAPLAVAYV